MPSSKYTGPELSNGIVGGFEPDLLVVTELEHAERIGWGKQRVTAFDQIVASEEGRALSVGTEASALYHHLFETRFRFKQRQPEQAVIPICSEPAVEPAVSATFGSFPDDQEGFPPYTEMFAEVFSAERVTVTPENLYSLLPTLYPLEASSFDLDVRGGRTRSLGGVTLYLLDPADPVDLMELWNLRTVDLDVLPVPLHWRNRMTPSFEWLLERLARGNTSASRPSDIKLLQGRKVEDDVFEEFRASFEALARPDHQTWVIHHPRIWDRWGRETDGFRLAQVSAKQVTHEFSIGDDGRLSFNDLEPEFSEYTVSYSVGRWVNVVRLRDYGGDPHFAEVFPPAIGDVARLLGDFHMEGLWASTEGLVASSTYRGARRSWSLPTGSDVFERYSEELGYGFAVSDAGRVTSHIASRLGSRNALSILRDLELLKFLNRMADGYEANGQYLLEKLKREKELFADAPKNRLRHLLGAGLLKVGLEVQCDTCRVRNLVELGAIDETITCRRCLDEFDFPAADPPRTWKYKVAGPMSAPDFARGGYSTLLAVRFLETVLGSHSQITWTPSFVVTDGDSETEVDFALWLDRSTFDPGWPYLVVGESKSGNSFERRDAKRLRDLARILPGCTLAVASFKSELTATEKRLLVPIARAAWKGRTASHLIVMTRDELFRDDVGGWAHADGRRLITHGPDALRNIAAETQRLNLDYDPYAEIRERLKA